MKLDLDRSLAFSKILVRVEKAFLALWGSSVESSMWSFKLWKWCVWNQKRNPGGLNIVGRKLISCNLLIFFFRISKSFPKRIYSFRFSTHLSRMSLFNNYSQASELFFGYNCLGAFWLCYKYPFDAKSIPFQFSILINRIKRQFSRELRGLF